MSPAAVNLHWIGIRKDSGKGAIWGWFTEIGKPDQPPYPWEKEDRPRTCHVFWGSIGKKLHIEEVDLTFEFLTGVSSRAQNYKMGNSNKIMSKWGQSFDEEFSMYLLMLKMKS
jgi:hypothetical protein